MEPFFRLKYPGAAARKETAADAAVFPVIGLLVIRIRSIDI